MFFIAGEALVFGEGFGEGLDEGLGEGVVVFFMELGLAAGVGFAATVLAGAVVFFALVLADAGRMKPLEPTKPAITEAIKTLVKFFIFVFSCFRTYIFTLERKCQEVGKILFVIEKILKRDLSQRGNDRGGGKNGEFGEYKLNY